MRKCIDGKGLVWFVVDNENISEGLNEALFATKGNYNNMFYPIVLNGQPCFAYRNTKGYTHFYINNEHWMLKKDGMCKHIDTLFNAEYHNLIDTVIKDNKFLIEHDAFIGLDQIKVE